MLTGNKNDKNNEKNKNTEDRLEIATKQSLRDNEGGRIAQKIKEELGFDLTCRYIDVYNFEEKLSLEEMNNIALEVFVDNILQQYSYQKPLFHDCWSIEVGMLPGVTDNVGTTATQAVQDKIGKKIKIYYSRRYALKGQFSRVDLDRIANMLHNPLIEKYAIFEPEEAISASLSTVNIPKEPTVEKVNILTLTKPKLEALAKQRLLAFSYEEMAAIKDYLKNSKVLVERKAAGLDSMITDVELEVLAQTWSEHCKHKIFNAQISYEENGDKHAINSLFKTFIRAATEQVKKPYVISVFKDNGGIIKFDHQYDIAAKVETHNSPSALNPYGGALTGILGVQRDVLGTGLGANPIANIDVLCFGETKTDPQEIPKKVLPPAVVYECVVKGIEHGGNKLGIPTVNGSIIFERDYLARPVVYCGAIGILPSEINARRTAEKRVEQGYLAVMVGGRIGKDGIHGATFSSMQLHSTIPQSVVQIGDPITQKKMLDFILEARNKRLYEAITDNGAGGLSSSIGEMAQLSNGCEIYLDKCPLKYPGLDPWEILVSESQERMTIAVPEQNLQKLLDLSKVHDVEITVVGKFTSSGKFHVFYKHQTVAYLDLKFLHEGVPQMKLKATWKRLTFPEPKIYDISYGEVLKRLLRAPNITSKERIIRRYDHEVKGMSVVKPLMPGPTDAAVLRPVYDSNTGLVISHGICPRYVQDSYSMAALAFDEAIRNAISVGAKFGYMACLDNFSWPDPVQSEKTSDGEYKLGQLVRACLALYDCAINYSVPIISGKDSMKNDYYCEDKKYSIPPTLLITVIGKIDHIRKAVTSDFKKSGALIYVLGKTRNELGGSEFYKLFNGIGNHQPHLFPEESVPLYRALSMAVEEGLVLSCHDLSDGGLAVAFAECAFSGMIGGEIELDNVLSETDEPDALLFSESAGRFIVTVDPKKAEYFEQVMKGTKFAKAGRVRGDQRVIIKKHGEIIINEAVAELQDAYNSGV